MVHRDEKNNYYQYQILIIIRWLFYTNYIYNEYELEI
jgi:hypothetical protein